ncbi:MAG: sigma-70 family RNA polymerase sigma factor [Planctomycetes bacterium]|nr:sigma-70 family RNA polymerase sigma factor [Planctomycetota bacterium]
MDPPRNSGELIIDAKAGDRRALETLVERCAPRLRSLVCLRLGHFLRRKVEIEDVLQETYLRACKSLERFQWRGKGSFYRWLGGIAEHVIQDIVRREGKGAGAMRSLQVLAPAEPGSSGSDRPAREVVAQAREPSPSQVSRRNERFERLEKALSRLSPEHREVIILARVRGVPIKDIAAKLGKTPDAVSMLLLRALRKLKECFAGSTSSFHLPARSLPDS